MYSKKESLVKLLKKLQKYWSVAEGIQVLIENIPVDDKILDGLLEIISNVIEKTNSQLEKSKFEQAMSIIKKIKKQEEDDKEDEDIESILNNI